MKISKKFAMRDVISQKEARKIAEDNEGTAVNVVRVVGEVKKFQSGQSNYGEWVAAIGNHAVTDLRTGEEIRTPKIFLPDAAMNLLEGSMPDTGSMAYAFDIGIQEPTGTSTVGYEYTVTPLIEPAENDPLTALMASVEQSSPLALPDAKKASKKA